MTRLRQIRFTLVPQEHSERWRNKSKHLIYSFLRVMRSGTWRLVREQQRKYLFIWNLYFYETLKGQREGWDYTQEGKGVAVVWNCAVCCLLFNWSSAKKLRNPEKTFIKLKMSCSCFTVQAVLLRTNCSEATVVGYKQQQELYQKTNMRIIQSVEVLWCGYDALFRWTYRSFLSWFSFITL